MIEIKDHDLSVFLLNNLEDVDNKAFKEYCTDEELTPQDALDKFSSDIEDVVEALYENACEKFINEINRFDSGELFDYDVETSFVDTEVLIAFIRRQAMKMRDEK